MQNDRLNLEVPKFTGESVPVSVAAAVMKKDPQFVRQGIVQGILPFGVALKKDGSRHYDYYISPLEFWRFTGYVYEGRQKMAQMP